MQSLAEGTMPDFCACCGAIQTPTWRKAFFKEIEGTPEGVTTCLDEPGAIVGYQVMQPQPEDKNPVAKYRVFKKSLTNTDKTNGDFTAMQLCNPCGLHFAKFGNMRPAVRWEVKARAAPPKKRGRPRRKKTDDKQGGLTSDAVQEPTSALYTDYPDEVMGYMQLDWSQLNEVQQDAPRQEEAQQDQPQQAEPKPNDDRPTDTEDNTSRPEGNSSEELPRNESQQGGPPMEQQRTPFFQERRATSLEPQREDSGDTYGWENTRAGAVLVRAIQSSPPRLVGTQENAIELEDSPSPDKPTRRLLFPSPHRTGRFKSLDDGQKEKQVQSEHGQLPPPPRSEPVADSQDKENVPPVEVDDSFADLFEDLDGNLLQSNPKTPKSTMSIRSVRELIKTPTSKSKRTALTPRDALLSPGNLAMNAAMDEFILQSTPSKAVKTPKTAMTPFSQSLHDLFGTGKTPRSAPRNNAGDNAAWGLSSPGNTGLLDFVNFDFSMPSTDVPFPSSPPHFGASFNFSLYEDPMTSTDNFWGGTSAFNGSDGLQGVQVDGETPTEDGAQESCATELGRIIDEVTASGSKSGSKEDGAEGADMTTTTTTTENDAENAGVTPAGSEPVDLIPVS